MVTTVNIQPDGQKPRQNLETFYLAELRKPPLQATLVTFNIENCLWALTLMVLSGWRYGCRSVYLKIYPA